LLCGIACDFCSCLGGFHSQKLRQNSSHVPNLLDHRQSRLRHFKCAENFNRTAHCFVALGSFFKESLSGLRHIAVGFNLVSGMFEHGFLLNFHPFGRVLFDCLFSLDINCCLLFFVFSQRNNHFANRRTDITKCVSKPSRHFASVVQIR